MALALVLLAGCVTTAQPTAPQDPGTPWSQVWDGPFAALGYGYGYVGVDEDGYGPPMPLVVVDHAGHVLSFTMAYRLDGNDTPALELDTASEAYRVPVTETLAHGVVYGQAPNAFRVTGAKGMTLSDRDWHAVRHALRDGVAASHDPREHKDAYVADGGTRLLFVDGHRATLDDNHDDGGGWADVEHQLELLQSWADG